MLSKRISWRCSTIDVCLDTRLSIKTLRRILDNKKFNHKSLRFILNDKAFMAFPWFKFTYMIIFTLRICKCVNICTDLASYHFKQMFFLIERVIIVEWLKDASLHHHLLMRLKWKHKTNFQHKREYSKRSWKSSVNIFFYKMSTYQPVWIRNKKVIAIVHKLLAIPSYISDLFCG